MMKVRLLDVAVLVTVGSLIWIVSQFPDDRLGVLWLYLAFVVAFMFSGRSLLAYLWVTVGSVIVPTCFMKFGYYKLGPHQVNLPWGVILTGAFGLFGSYLGLHIFIKALIFLCRCVATLLAFIFNVLLRNI